MAAAYQQQQAAQQQAAAWGAAAQQQAQAATQWTAAQQQQWQQQQVAWQQAAAQQQQAQQQAWQQQQAQQQQQQNGANTAAWQQQQQQQQQQQAQAQAQQGAANSKDCTLVVTGCSHATVGGIVRGTFQLAGENHGKPTYKKDGQVNGLDVMTYYWDERDGDGFCGWWFGPKVGGDQVWAYHSDKAASMPPQTGWKVPYDGPVDPTFVISMKPKAGAQQQQAQQGQQQQGWPQQQQAWGQQQQWTPEQNAQYQMQMAKKMEEQKRLQEQQQQLQALKMRQQQQNQQQANQMRQGQLAEQARKLEENRKRLEEMNRHRQVEQQRQMEIMKQKQAEAMKKRQEELEKQKVEQTHVLSIRRVLQKFRAATPSTFEACKTELDEVLAKELEGCGTQKERVMTESEQAIVQTKQRMEQLEAEYAKRKEQKAKALELLAQLEQDMVKAEEKAKGVVEELEPLKGEKDLKISEIEATVTAVEDAAKEANAAAEVCTEFIKKEAVNIKGVAQIDGEEPHTLANDLNALTARLVNAKKLILDAMNTCKTENAKRIKKAHAKEKLDELEKTFKKYANKQGDVGRKEVQAYAKGEFNKFKLPEKSLDSICNVLIPEGSKGIAKENIHRMLAMIGIAREGALDEKRRAAREAREKEIAEKKEEIVEKVAAAGELIKAATEKVVKLETESSDSKIGPLKDKSSTDLNSVADAVDASMNETKDSIKTANDAIVALNEEVEAELKAFLMSEIKKLEVLMKPLDVRVTKVSGVGGKLRSHATVKAAQELDKLRGDALEVISYHQGEKNMTNEEIFAVFDTKKAGKIEESQFLKFFAKHKMKTKEGEEAAPISEDDLSRLFTYLDGEETGCITKEKFIGMVKKFMKVVKASVITDGKSIKSKILRRLEEGEVVEVITGASVEEHSEVKRMRVKALQDGLDGWVTPVGNAGTVFFEEGGNTYKVVKETLLTGTFVIGAPSNQKDRKLKVGEVVEVREWERKEETSGLMRMQVRVKSDGQIGWATSVGNTGITFLEME